MIYLVDTSLWIHALRSRGNKTIREKLRPLILAGNAVLTPWIVLELMTGIRSGEEQKNLNAFLEPLTKLQVEDACWPMAWELAAHLRKKGVTSSAADCLIASMAIKNEIPLLHTDQDFTEIAQHSRLQEISWIEYL